eukprot:366521-Chlamydomonas_euryale.AAC.3
MSQSPDRVAGFKEPNMYCSRFLCERVRQKATSVRVQQVGTGCNRPDCCVPHLMPCPDHRDPPRSA